MRGLAHGINWVHTGDGAGRGESRQQRPRFLCSRQARVPCSAPTPLLTAGSFGCSAPGRSGRESPTPGSACSRLSGGHTPARTENLDSQETGSRPSWKREGAHHYLSRGTSLATTAETQGAPRLRAHSSPPGVPAQNTPCSARHWNLFDRALPSASNTVLALLCLVELIFTVQVSARSSLQRGRSDISSKLGHGPSSDLSRCLRRCPPARSTSSPLLPRSTYAPEWTWKEPTSLPSQPMACREG